MVLVDVCMCHFSWNTRGQKIKSDSTFGFHLLKCHSVRKNVHGDKYDKLALVGSGIWLLGGRSGSGVANRGGGVALYIRSIVNSQTRKKVVKSKCSHIYGVLNF